MTGRTKFEQMLEHLVNEDTEKAQELFHQIVVEKSREIYENILEEDFEVEAKHDDDDEEMDETKDEDDEESVEETKDEDDEEVEENFAFGEADDEMDMGDDSDAEMDMDMDDEGGDEMDMGDEGSDDLEDRVVDLEDAIDDLRAEFEKMMGDDEMGDDEMGGDIGGPDGGDMGDDLESDITMKDDMFMREYVEKVGGADYTKYGKMGDNGANTKSTVAGKNDMGGTTANILSGGESTTGGTKGGLANPSPKDMNTGNINVPGGNAGKTAFKKKEPGHGAEKKSTGDNGDRSADSPINGVKSRAK
jgi:hypothetical protein